MAGTVRARIHVLLARDVPFGVVIRRGPASSVAAIGWDRLTDRFEVGQWLRGRIYEHRADLSPDGKHLLYFALNGRWQSDTGGAWTALSKAPYLKAVALWAQGHTWGGGGLFVSADEYWLNAGCVHELLRDDSGLTCTTTPLGPVYGHECGVYHERLRRDGWRMRPDIDIADRKSITVFEKAVNSTWTLRKRAHADSSRVPGRGCYFDEHDLVHVDTGEIVSHPTWEWADVDRDRLVWAEAGQLRTGVLAPNSLEHVRLLYDFDPLRFEPRVAPY